MKKYLLAATLIAAFAVPASAKPHYIMYNKATKTCSISKTAPSETEKFSMMGLLRVHGHAHAWHDEVPLGIAGQELRLSSSDF
jgi:hypothetical protein